MPETVATLPKLKAAVVSGVLKSVGHRLVSDRPIAQWNRRICFTALQKHTNRLSLGGANQIREVVTTPDIRERATVTKHTSETIG